MKFTVAILLLCLVPFSGVATPGAKTVLIVQQCRHDASSGDTLFLSYCNVPISFDDTLVKYCGADTANITDIFIVNPSQVIASINFRRFTKLNHLVLAGNDVNCLDSIRYDFFNCSTLKKITLSSVYVSEPDRDCGFIKHRERKTKKYIHRERPDVKVKYVGVSPYWFFEG